MKTPVGQDKFTVLPLNPVDIAAAILGYKRCLLFGHMGIGKSTLAAQLMAQLNVMRQACYCLNADPGSPAFGVPGALSLASWENNVWRVVAYAPLCSLDAGRFRLPLTTAVTTLLSHAPAELVLIDAPGVVRGVAGSELLAGLAGACGVDCVLALTPRDQAPLLPDELHALAATVYVVQAAPEAQRPGKRSRARERTLQWEQYLVCAFEQTCQLDKLSVVGTPPPMTQPQVWTGRQVGFLLDGRMLAMGEVSRLEEQTLHIIAAGDISQADTLLVRDAMRNAGGLLETAAPFAAERLEYLPPADVTPDIADNTGPRIVGRVGAVDVGLVNGVFGDPLLHCRIRQEGRSLLFDLGDGSRLPARIAHQVSDVFITHAHLDHIGGFIWLLRSRMGDYPPCRIYGPPGLARHIAGFLQGILWDRIADTGPRFDVWELHGECVRHYRLQAGYEEHLLHEEATVRNGVLLKDTGFQISAVTLDHHGTPVLAYAFQQDKQINVRKERLKARGLQPGPWLNELKQYLLAGSVRHKLQLPDQTEASVEELAADLIVITPGKKLVYATDLADSAENRRRLIQLAQDAHTLFCEASFVEADADFAQRNGHLTTRACAEIATAAAVSRLVPFHFSRRYADKAQQVFDELSSYCTWVFMPRSMQVFTSSVTSLQPVIPLDEPAQEEPTA